VTWLYGPAGPDPAMVSTPARKRSQDETSTLPSVLKSALIFPIKMEERHVNFSEQVNQFVSLNISLDENMEFKPSDCDDSDDSDSDDGLMMKFTTSKSKSPLTSERKISSQGSVDSACKTIAILPPTTLKIGENCSSLVAGLEGDNKDMGMRLSIDSVTRSEESVETQRQLATALALASSSNRSEDTGNNNMLYRDAAGFTLVHFYIRLVNLGHRVKAVARTISKMILRK
jgi:hypothetical protein